jgi:hypothetical protein
MRVQRKSIEDAKQTVRGLILKHEQDFMLRKEEFYKTHLNVSLSLRRSAEVSGIIIGSNHYVLVIYETQ